MNALGGPHSSTEGCRSSATNRRRPFSDAFQSVLSAALSIVDLLPKLPEAPLTDFCSFDLAK